MKLSSGKRIGQSGHEFTAAVLFSFILHVIILFAAVLLLAEVTPRTYTPPFYEVKLVGQPADLTAQTPAPQPPAPAPAEPPKLEEPKAPAKAKKAPPKAARAEPKKGAMPALEGAKAKPEAEQPAPAAPAPQPPAAGAAGAGQSAAKAEGVIVSSRQDFKFGWYLAAVRDKIQQNWSPPPASRETTARVLFTVNRSGWVGQVKLDDEHSNGSFDFKAAAIRAIRSSNPFPSLPEEFSRQTLEFSVDLTPKE